MEKFKTIEEYHNSFPAHIKLILEKLYNAIKIAAPKATETISYGMPAFKQNKILVYYAAHKGHIGFYPTPHPIEAFRKELEKFKTSKGAIQFPLDRPLPVALIKKIVEFRVEEIDKNPTTKPKVNLNKDIQSYNDKLVNTDKTICNLLFTEIKNSLPEAESKIWHGHPVWFMDGNPIVGYDKLKDGVRLLFWSGQSFDEPSLQKEGKFKAAETRYTSAEQIILKVLKGWLKKSREIQWDYKNIVKRKGVLERLK